MIISKQLHLEICFVHLVLCYTEIPLGYVVGRVIKYLHNENRGDLLGCPGMIPPSFAEAMTTDLSVDPECSDCLGNDTPSLDATDRAGILPVIDEDIIPAPIREIELQGVESLFVNGNFLLLSGFLFGQGEMRPKLIPFGIVDIFPSELQEIADPKCRAYAEND